MSAGCDGFRRIKDFLINRTGAGIFNKNKNRNFQCKQEPELSEPDLSIKKIDKSVQGIVYYKRSMDFKTYIAKLSKMTF